MINLLVDEAYAFDYLSILQVKKEKSNLEKDYNAWATCYAFLQKQFDEQKWSSMIYSIEYKNIVEANNLTFEAVDKAKTNKVTAKYVDYCNYKRYIAKQEFQKKFFENNLSESKIGYNKYD